MFLRIVDWISRNQNLMLSKEINEYCIEEPKSIVNRNIDFKRDHRHRTSSLVTSVLNFSLAPQNDSGDHTFNNLEENKNLFAKNNQDSCITVTEGAPELTKQKPEEFVCNQPSVTSNNISHPFAYSEEFSSFKPYTSDAKRVRNSWTQTEAILDNRRRSSIIKHSHRHTLHQIPEYQKKVRSFPNYKTRSQMSRNHAFVSFKEKSDDDSDSFIYPEFEKKIRACTARPHDHSFILSKGKPDSVADSDIYGALYVFGCNGVVPEHLVEKMNSKYILRKRRKANGIKEAYSYVRSNGESLSESPAKHIITYPLSHNRSVVVAFKHDPLSDMFQVGRDEKYPIDFRVVDINPLETSRNGVSRFACRILVRRDGNHEARVFAAAFDSSQTIFMGESGIPSTYSGKMDGFTTNGVLIMHPGKGNPGVWREVSVSGNIYPLRTGKTDISKRPRLLEESNVLQDGTMIDLCGVTLVWRSSGALKNIPHKEHLRRLQNTLCRSLPECELLKRDSKLQIYEEIWATKKAFVYMSCGHVIGLKMSKSPEDLQKWSCPVCRVIGPIKELKIGLEPGFYIDREFPSHAFRPCGHAASLETIKFWSSTEIPIHRSIQDSHCPFCGVKLSFINKCVKLIIPKL